MCHEGRACPLRDQTTRVERPRDREHVGKDSAACEAKKERSTHSRERDKHRQTLGETSVEVRFIFACARVAQIVTLVASACLLMWYVHTKAKWGRTDPRRESIYSKGGRHLSEKNPHTYPRVQGSSLFCSFSLFLSLSLSLPLTPSLSLSLARSRSLESERERERTRRSELCAFSDLYGALKASNPPRRSGPKKTSPQVSTSTAQPSSSTLRSATAVRDHCQSDLSSSIIRSVDPETGSP